MTIDRKQLQEKLNILQLAVLAKSDLVYQTALRWNDDVLSTTTGFSSIKTSIDIGLLDNFKALIPFKLFKQIIDKINTQTVDLELEENKLLIKAGRSKFTLNVMNAENIQPIEFEEGTTQRIEYSIIKDIAEKVEWCCANDNKKPILKAVNLKSDNGLLNVVATDSLKLAKLSIPTELNLDINIAGDDILNISRIFNEGDNISIVVVNEGKCYFTNGLTYYAPCRMEGNYPDTTRLIPNPNHSLKVNREDLLQALDRISVLCGFTKDVNIPLVRLKINNNSININNEITQIGLASDVVECQTELEMQIGCNANNLINALKTFTSEEVYLNITANVRPFTITNADDENDGLIQLILPIKIEE